MDWASRKVLAWRLGITPEVRFCSEALQEALAKYGAPVTDSRFRHPLKTCCRIISTVLSIGRRNACFGGIGLSNPGFGGSVWQR